MFYSIGMDYFTVRQAAEALGITPRGVRQRIDRGVMHAVLVHPRLLMIARADVERARQQGRLRPGPKLEGIRTRQRTPMGE